MTDTQAQTQAEQDAAAAAADTQAQTQAEQDAAAAAADTQAQTQAEQDAAAAAAQAQPSPLERVSQAFDGFTTTVQGLGNAKAEAANRGTTTEQLRQRLAQSRTREEEQLAQAEARETEADSSVGSMRTNAVSGTDALISALKDFRTSL